MGVAGGMCFFESDVFFESDDVGDWVDLLGGGFEFFDSADLNS
ncbi:hypothetical protein Hanom_Chr13g01223681 [Helianthus anomalus]